MTLNSLIAAVLLQEQSDSIMMKDLIQRTGTIYAYLMSKKKTCTNMTLVPQQLLVERHLTGLGFKMQDKGKKNCKILLAQKNDDFRLMLSLAHYSLRLGSVFVSE